MMVSRKICFFAYLATSDCSRQPLRQRLSRGLRRIARAVTLSCIGPCRIDQAGIELNLS